MVTTDSPLIFQITGKTYYVPFNPAALLLSWEAVLHAGTPQFNLPPSWSLTIFTSHHLLIFQTLANIETTESGTGFSLPQSGNNTHITSLKPAIPPCLRARSPGRIVPDAPEKIMKELVKA